MGVFVFLSADWVRRREGAVAAASAAYHDSAWGRLIASLKEMTGLLINAANAGGLLRERDRAAVKEQFKQFNTHFGDAHATQVEPPFKAHSRNSYWRNFGNFWLKRPL